MASGVRSIEKRVALLEKKYPPPPVLTPAERREKRRRRKRLDELLTRLDRLIIAAGELMSEEEDQRVQAGLDQLSQIPSGPYYRWIMGLLEGRSALPEVPPEAMKTILLAWLTDECQYFSCVCNRCGLHRPDRTCLPSEKWKRLPGQSGYDLPEIFDACPGCGAPLHEMNWAHLVEEKTWEG